MTEAIEEVRELPKGWVWTDAITVCSSIRDGTRDTPKYVEKGIPLVTSKNLKNGRIDFLTAKFISYEDHCQISIRSGVESGDILFSIIGTIGNPVVIQGDQEFSIKNLGLFKKNESVVNSYFLNFWLSSRLLEKITEEKQLIKGTTQKFIPLGNLRALPIPFAPFKEQQRIVEKVEELFSELDQGVESLKTAQKQLKIYRQAVLKRAFEGKLSEAWREKHDRSSIKTGKALLAQIKAERENRYQQQLTEWETAVEKWEAIGKVGKQPGKPQKLKKLLPLTEADLSELPQFPDKWCLEKLGNLLELGGGVIKGRDLKGQETISLPYLRVANVQDGYLDLSVVKYIDVLPSELDKYRLIAGDVLYTEGGDKDKLGRSTVWKEEVKDCIHQNHVFRARLLSKSLIPAFIAYYSQTRIAKDYFFRRAKQTVNLAYISMTILSNFSIPIPSYLEQEKIVQEIELRLSICDRLEATIVENLQKAEALRQSILKQAFEGKLVPQDPNDEPAEKLLERIKQEKTKLKQGKQLSLEDILEES